MAATDKAVGLSAIRKVALSIINRIKSYIGSLTAQDFSAADSLSYENNILSLKSGESTLTSVTLDKTIFDDTQTMEGDGDFILTDEEVTDIFTNAPTYVYSDDGMDSDLVLSETEIVNIFDTAETINA